MTVTDPGARPARRTQADRRDATRAALLESAARHLSRYGYGNLVLEQVARDAGYTRGALYHQFADKQELTQAALAWVLEAWDEEVGRHVAAETDPVAALLTLARRHAVLCRRDLARAPMALRVEFSGQDHPVGQLVENAYALLTDRCHRLITTGRRLGAIPKGAPSRVVAQAFVGALEGASIALAGQRPYDEELVVKVAVGVLGLPQKDRRNETAGPSRQGG